MADIIKDGTGNGYSAKVTSSNRILTDTIREPVSSERSRQGFLFGTGTGSLPSAPLFAERHDLGG